MTDRSPVSHADHDPLLMAAFAAGDLAPADRERAELQGETCAECALLATDLRAIATATAALPPRSRPRDFALGAQDAARLRRRGWRGLVRPFAGPRYGALRPLAAGLTTLGIAGLLLAAAPMALPGGTGAPGSGPSVPAAAASGGVRNSGSDSNFGPLASPAPAREGDQYSVQSEQPVPVRGPAARPAGSPQALDAASGGKSQAGESAAPAQAGAGVGTRAASPLVVLSGTFLILGLGLFGLRWTARRLGDG